MSTRYLWYTSWFVEVCWCCVCVLCLDFLKGERRGAGFGTPHQPSSEEKRREEKLVPRIESSLARKWKVP